MKVITCSGQDVTKTIRCLDGWITSINSLIWLWSVLKEQNFKYILTRRLSQDCIEHFFGMIRQQGGNSKNPTPIQFKRAFKKSFVAKLLEVISQGNCEITEKTIETLNSPLELHIEEEIHVRSDLIMRPTDIKEMHPAERNAFVYFAGYLAKKCKEKHSCGVTSALESHDVTFILFKEFEQCNLIIPEHDFVEYIKKTGGCIL